MANIITSKTRLYSLSKPPFGAFVDFGRSIADKMTHCLLFNESGGSKYAFNACGNRVSRFVIGSAVRINSGSVYLASSGGVVNTTEKDSGSVFVLGSPFTFYARVLTRGKGQSNLGAILGRGGSYAAYLGLSGGTVGNYSLCFSYNGTTPLIRTSADNFIHLNVFEDLCITWDGTNLYSGVHMYMNCIESPSYQENTNGATLASSASNAISIGDSVLRGYNGIVNFSYVWNRVLTIQEIRGLYAHPYQFISRRKEVTYSIPDTVSSGNINIITSKTRKYATDKPPVGSQLNFGHPLSQGMVGAWLMNEGGGMRIKDLCNIRHGTFVNNATTWSSSIKGIGIKAIKASSPQIDCGNGFSNLNSGFTCKIICIPLLNDATSKALFSTAKSATSTITIGYNALNWKSNFNNGTGFAASSNDNSIILGSIYDIVSVWNGSTLKLYANLISKSGGTGLPGNTTDVTTMCYATGANRYDGLLFSIMFWNRPLAIAEIQSLYQAPYQMISPPRSRRITSFGGGAYTPQLYTREITDSLSPTDTVFRRWEGSRIYTDAITPSDTVNRIWTMPRTLNDNITPADNTNRLWTMSRAVSDNITPADIISRKAVISRIVNDAITPTDIATRLWIANRIVPDSITPTDSVLRSWNALRVIADALTMVDTESEVYIPAGGGTKYTSTIQDALTIQDTVSRGAKLVRILNEIAQLADTLTREAKLGRTILDSAGVSDTATAGTTVPVSYLTVSDLVYMYDTVIATMPGKWTISTASTAGFWTNITSTGGTWTNITSSGGLWTKIG